MSNTKLISQIANLDDNILLADGFDDAVIGLTYRENELVALYSSDKVIQLLTDKENMPYECAVEYFEYNIVGAYMGAKTPVFYSFDYQAEE